MLRNHTLIRNLESWKIRGESIIQDFSTMTHGPCLTQSAGAKKRGECFWQTNVTSETEWLEIDRNRTKAAAKTKIWCYMMLIYLASCDITVQLFHETLLKHWSPGRSQRAQKSMAPKNVASHQPKAAPNAGRLNKICPGQRKQPWFWPRYSTHITQAYNVNIYKYTHTRSYKYDQK